MKDQSSDRELLEHLSLAHDATAFHELYIRHTPSLFAMARRLCGQVSDAEDIVHDTWLRAVTGVSRFRDQSSVRTWLMAILINRTRETRREPKHESIDCIPDALVSTDSSIDFETIDLNAALARMPHGYREVVLLHDVEGFTHQEIAVMLGIEPGTSKSQLARARRWIRGALTSMETSDE